MKHIILIFTLFTFIGLQAKNDIVVRQNVKDTIKHDDNEGRDFLIAFPYNDTKDLVKKDLTIYVISQVETFVTVYNDALQIYISSKVVPGQIFEFSTKNEFIGWASEIYTFEKSIGLGIRILAKDPVKVYVVSSKLQSTEGYMAIPIRKWGTEYIHNSYYDFNEEENWGGGFVVLANEDDTKINIKLKDGANNEVGFGQTTGKRKHGDEITVTLNHDQVYAVQGNGATSGVFDLSGSSISANKPIGVISYHNRAKIPVTTNFLEKDFLVEMIPPISAWGKEYFTLEYPRYEDKGDYYRVIAGEDNVTFNVVSYDKYTKEKLKETGDITLSKKGDWIEFFGKESFAPNEKQVIVGNSHFKADGKILVFQYTFSDVSLAVHWEPFMTSIPSVSQFTNNTIYQTLKNPDATNDWGYSILNLIALGDAKDSIRNYNLLNSIEIDGEKIFRRNREFETYNIPNTDYFWIALTHHHTQKDRTQYHHITGDTKFGATIQGQMDSRNYSWPVTSNSNNLSIIDTISPNVEVVKNDMKIIFKVSDKHAGVDGIGFNRLPEMLTDINNFTRPVIVDSNGVVLINQNVNRLQEYYFSIDVYDKFKTSTSFIKILDRNYNETEIEITYKAPYSLEYEKEFIIYGRVGIKSTKTLSIKNNDKNPLVVEDVYLSENSLFQLNNIKTPLIIESESEKIIEISLTPKDNYDGGTKLFYTDSLGIKADGSTFFFKLQGFGINPEVEISNFSFKKAKQNTGIHPQIGKIKIKNSAINWLSSQAPLRIKSLKFDENAPDANLFTNLRLSSGEMIEEFNGVTLNNNETLELEFDLNTDLADTPGLKYGRIIVESDAGPADENGKIPNTINSYKYEFDGQFTAENMSAINDGGYIQSEITFNPSSSIEEESNINNSINILNSEPVSGNNLNIEINSLGNSVVSISSIDGIELKRIITSDKHITFDISSLPTGVYFIKMSGGKINGNKKFLIER